MPTWIARQEIGIGDKGPARVREANACMHRCYETSMIRRLMSVIGNIVCNPRGKVAPGSIFMSEAKVWKFRSHVQNYALKQ